MPMYRHECTECNHVDEHLYPFAQFELNEVMDCPKCGKHTYKRVIAGCAFDIVGYCYANSEHGPKGRWRKDLAKYQAVLDGKQAPY